MDVDVFLWVDGRLKQWLEDVSQQLFKVVYHRVLTIHVAVEQTDRQTDGRNQR